MNERLSDPEQINGELIAAAQREVTVEAFLSTFGGLLWSSPLAVERLFLSLQTIHPAFRSRTYLWQHDTERVSVVEWPHGLKNRPGYYHSPDHHVHSTSTELRVTDLQSIGPHRCDLYGKLRAQGYTDYLIVPLPFSDGTVNTLSIATRQAGEFPGRALDRFRRMAGLLVIIFERYAALETRSAALETYLGRGAAHEVLKGRIRSGHGEEVEAAILFADLHGFTRLSADLSPLETVRLLNTYFDCLVGPIEEHGGYVLKFIGDAILAFFPSLPDGPVPQPLESVVAIRCRLEELNAVREAMGDPPLRHALCVHFGRVLYGNIGSSERLDFTVIGEPVNVASRALHAAKGLKVEYLFTGEFVSRFGANGLDTLGLHSLHDVANLKWLFTFEDAVEVPRDWGEGDGHARTP